jgi:hypothetical protein
LVDYWRTKEKLRRSAALLASLAERTDLDPALRNEIERGLGSKIGQYRLDLQQYEAADPAAASSTPPTQRPSNEAKTEEENWLQGLVDAGVVDSFPDISDEEADAFEPIRIEGRPVSEDIIEGRP